MKQHYFSFLFICLITMMAMPEEAFAQFGDPQVIVTQSKRKPSQVTFSTIMLAKQSDFAIKSAKISPAVGSDDPSVTHVLTIELRDRIFGNNRGVLFEQVTSEEVKLDANKYIEVIIIFNGQFVKKKRRGLMADEQFD
jgi:hypothetical protein